MVNVLTSVSKAKQFGIYKLGKQVFYSPVHFPVILGTIMVSGTVTGFFAMDFIHSRRVQVRIAISSFKFLLLIAIRASHYAYCILVHQELDAVYEVAWESYSRRR